MPAPIPRRMGERGTLFLCEPVHFIEDVKPRPVCNVKITQNLVHFFVQLGVMRIRDVAHLQNKRGFLYFLKRGAERRQQALRQSRE